MPLDPTDPPLSTLEPRAEPETEPWFRTLAETTSTAIFVYQADRVVYANRAAEELSGYSQDEIRAMLPWQIAHPDDRAMVERRAGARLSGQEPQGRYEMRIHRKDGEERWIEVTAGLIASSAGEPAALVNGVDITERKRSAEALRRSNENLELAQRVAGAVVWEWNLLTDAMPVSPHAAEVLGCRPEEIWQTGAAFLACVHPEDQEGLVQALRRCLSDGEVFETEIRICLPGGKIAWLSERGRAFHDDSGIPTRLLGVAQNISRTKAAEIERKKAEAALAQERERAQVTLASIGDGVIRTDALRRVDYLNPVAERLTGWPAEQAVGRSLGDVFRMVDEVHRRPLPDPAARCLAEGRVIESPGYALLLGAAGEEFSVRESAAPVRDRTGQITGCVLVFKDVTELRGMEREMIYLARHDPLTGLINRREFESRLLHALESARLAGREHALLYLDLDEFKVVNDTCGHLVGDEMLKQVSGQLRSQLRPFDTLARLGGDEFGVLLEDTSIERARQLAEGVREAIKRSRFVWQERIFDFGVSLGLVPINAESGDMGQVLSAADAACYVAKESGRNRIHEYQPDDTALAERHGVMQWVSRIHKAFEEERFCLYRQRIEPLRPDCLALFEVFIRLIDEDGRVVAPSAFIPAAERYHLASTLDRWVIHSAFVTLACSSLSHDDPTGYALNLSGQSLGEESFLDYVLAEVETTGVNPHRISFEITETAAVANLGQATRFIAALKKLGCSFVLDDFGSGLSSFAYLKNLQVDFLKIDGAFVRNMLEVPIQRALVESIHHIGQVMKIGTIAESVEDRDTLEALREIGVDYVQGYTVAQPEPWV